MAEESTRAVRRHGSPIALAGVIGIIAVILTACGTAGAGTVGATAATSSAEGEPDPAAQRLSPRDLVTAFKRSGVGPDQVAIDLTYAPPIFFETTGLVPPPEITERPTLAFMLEETVHDGDLADAPPTVLLMLETGEQALPYGVQITATDPHHRTTRLLFADPGPRSPDPMDPGPERTLTLVIPFADGTVSAGNTFEWRLPIDLAAGAPTTSLGASR